MWWIQSEQLAMLSSSIIGFSRVCLNMKDVLKEIKEVISGEIVMKKIGLRYIFFEELEYKEQLREVGGIG